MLRRRRWGRRLMVPLVVGALYVAPGVVAPASAADTVTYTASQTIPVPPASAYGGSAGGDGWGLAFSPTQVFNVFHHSTEVTIACHNQVDAANCWDPRRVTDPVSQSDFSASGHPGLTYDVATNSVYVYTTRVADGTAGVLCVDVALAATSTNPFCGFTALTAVGHAPLIGGLSALSEPVKIGTKWYAYSYVNGQPAVGADNALLCFDLTTKAACASQPFSVPFGAGNVSVGYFPEPQTAAIGGRVIVATSAGGVDQLGCFDVATGAGCVGSWPVLSPGYTASYGAPFPKLDPQGAVTGFCLPTANAPCYTLAGASVATPAGLAAAIPASEGWNGNAVTVGPRVFVPNGNYDQVFCFSWATGAGCPSFPKSFSNLGFLYTVNPDPARPTCLWVNADYGSQQIQNFDAYTGGACGAGPIRVLASSFVVDTQLCQPASYTSLQITEPPRSGYDSGSIKFQDADANQLPGVNDADLDATGSATLTGKNLSTALGLPQFLITLVNAHQAVGQVGVTLTWTGVNDPSCVKPGTIVDQPPPSGSVCGDAVFLAVPGSGENFKNPGNLFVSRELKAVYDGMKSTSAPKQVGFRVINNPAVSAKQLSAGLEKAKGANPADYATVARAKLASNLGRYLAFRQVGAAALWAEYANVRANCPAGTKIVLGGYSQGAMIVHEFLNELAAGNDTAGKAAIVGAVLIADPERVANSAVAEAANVPAASPGVCDFLRATVNCAAPGSVSDVSPTFRARTTSVCAMNDDVCDTGTVFADLVAHWSSAKAKADVLTRSRKVHGGYASLPATRNTGKALGTVISTS